MATGPNISPSFINTIKEILAKEKTSATTMSQPSASASTSTSTLTPQVIVARPLAMSPPWMVNEMRHPALRTPPATVAKEAMITPEVQQIYQHHDLLDEKFVPNNHQMFDGLEQAFEFYREYAELAGFPIKRNRKRGAEGQDFCCSFEGKHVPKVTEEDRKREKTSKRDGCKAMVCANMIKGSEQFFFTRILLGHNHKLDTYSRLIKFMRNHKVVDEATLGMLDVLQDSRVPHANVMSVLRNVVGGSENLNLTERDVQNRKAAHVREERADDIPKLLSYFKECKANNPQFFYELQLDENNVVKNVFWSHASQQGGYADYGDVVTFDTTYRTNQYSMPLAMFVGFNSQLQNVIFAQALIRDERADTFEWVFQQFKTCMGGKEPTIIFTDQDSSMEKAIKVVFEKTYHRYCRWHITNKYKNELNQLFAQHPGTEGDPDDPSLSDTLVSIINHPLVPNEFENAWSNIIERYNLHGSKVMLKLYDDRHMWISSYFKEIFCGPMTSTQRSESVNAVIKTGYADNSTALHEFAKSFLELLEHTYENEARENFNSQAPNITSTFFRFEKQLSKVYTRPVYQRFRKRLKSSTAFYIREDPDPNKKGYYLLSHMREPADFPWLQHQYSVKATIIEDNPEDSVFSCECMSLEHTGMFCCHLIRAFTHLQVQHVPAKYVLKRYSRDPHMPTSFDRNDRMFVGPDGDTKARRTYSLLQDFYKLLQKAIMSEEGHDKCKEIIKDAHAVIDPIPHDIGVLAGAHAISAAATQQEDDMQPTSGVHANISRAAPPISTTKGGRKRPLENIDVPEPHFKRKTPSTRSRRCSKCNMTGHNSTTCGRPAPAPKSPRGRPFGTGRGRGKGRRHGGCKTHYSGTESEDEAHSSQQEQDDCTPSTSES